MTSILYISYDGMLEPLGQSQVLGYLEKLAGDHAISLISFEKKKDREDAPRMAAMRARLKAAGIAWTPLAYHKAPSAPATAYDIAVGTATAIAIALRRGVRIVHARSYVAALMALGVKRLTGARLLFDMRGFWADERVDGGLWPAGGRLFRTAKALERRFLTAADHVVTLTHASVREMARFDYLAGRMPPVTVIPTCADLDLFSPRPRAGARPFTLGSVGSVGTWYRFDEVLACYTLIRARRPDARLLIVNRNEQETIRRMIAQAGIEPGRVEIIAAAHREVPDLIAHMDAGTAIIKPVYSKIASAPTKLAEYLGCGVPCLGNDRVGDMAEVLEGRRVGAALTDFSEADRQDAVKRLLALCDDPDTPRRCVDTARGLFSLEGGVEAYRKVYESLSASPAPRSVPIGKA
jgi:glycosyltransferase involved in cell wall biosynthesis